jgi:hypothetical protein
MNNADRGKSAMKWNGRQWKLLALCLLVMAV